ncbi:unknown [Oscillibacter sp. CAG:155]|nr:unknown [Oscillibacter sp. CAG:155]
MTRVVNFLLVKLMAYTLLKVKNTEQHHLMD